MVKGPWRSVACSPFTTGFASGPLPEQARGGSGGKHIDAPRPEILDMKPAFPHAALG